MALLGYDLTKYSNRDNVKFFEMGQVAGNVFLIGVREQCTAAGCFDAHFDLFRTSFIDEPGFFTSVWNSTEAASGPPPAAPAVGLKACR